MQIRLKQTILTEHKKETAGGDETGEPVHLKLYGTAVQERKYPLECMWEAPTTAGRKWSLKVIRLSATFGRHQILFIARNTLSPLHSVAAAASHCGWCFWAAGRGRIVKAEAKINAE